MKKIKTKTVRKKHNDFTKIMLFQVYKDFTATQKKLFYKYISISKEEAQNKF